MDEILNAGRDRRVLVHDGDESMTGAIWALFRTIGEGVALDKALEEGRALGLEDADLVGRIEDFVSDWPPRP